MEVYMLKCTSSISFDPELMATINEYCTEKGCSRSWLVNKAVIAYFEKLEDKEDYETAVTVLEEFEKSGSKGYTSEEIRKEFDL